MNDDHDNNGMTLIYTWAPLLRGIHSCVWTFSLCESVGPFSLCFAFLLSRGVLLFLMRTGETEDNPGLSVLEDRHDTLGE